MYIEATVNGTKVRHSFNEPEHIPQIGDIYAVQRSFITAGNVIYKVGDELLMICRTDEAPHGRLSSLGNLFVQGVDAKTSIWSNIELAVTENTIAFKKSIFETVA